VLLVFWASWCGPCMADVPHERELVARMKDRPFVLLGVNGDPMKEAAQKVIEREKMTWRSFQNGGHDGPITKAWNISSWPSFYVLDAKGVIQVKQMANKMMDLEIERLTKQVESERK
jgi:thiol-disulfide isomerase/thioredoxin